MHACSGSVAWLAFALKWGRSTKTMSPGSAFSPKGSGWALSASYQVNDDFLPFFRMGHSDGGAGVAAENAASLGFEYNPRMDQAWTLGVGWAEPSRKTFGKGLDDEWAFETSYKFQMSKNFSFTPDLQLVLNPARVPEKSSVWILGLRGILMM